MRLNNAFKIGMVCFAFALALHDGAWAQIPEHDITVGRTIHTDKPVCLVYRDDGFWVTQGITEDTLSHYSTDGTLLAEYQLPGSVQRYGVAWDGTHWWIGDNNYGSETIYKCELNEAEKRLEPVRAYAWPHLGPSGLEWAQGYLWVSDDATDIIYRVSVGDTFFTAIEAWCLTNPEPWDLAWDGANMWSITGPGGGFDPVHGEREIYKHDAAGNIIEIWHYPPADDPGQGSYGGCGTGLAFAGSQLWYCDLDRNEIIEGIRGASIGWIAFGSNRDGDLDIWAVRPDGMGLRQITNMPGSEFTPQWSPDSTKIAYATATDAQIWIYDWFTGTNTKIFDGADYGGMYYAAEPAWSPDGKRILFQGQTTYNNPHIAVINADGSGRRTIVPIEGGYVSGPSWCPSGTAFVYDRRNSGASFSPDLWIYDFTATGDITNGVNHRLTAGAGSESTTKFNSDWTPSGDIVFCWGHNLVIIDPGQSPNWIGPISNPSDPHMTFLTNDASYPSIRYSYPSWSPDLSQVVYADESAATGTYDLWIIDAQPGGNRHPVMTTPYGESYPDWGNPTPEPQPPPVYYVDSASGSDDNDGLTRRTAFATIGKGIDSARNGFKVLVYLGVYQEEVDFKGKAITIQGVATKAGIPIIENPGDFAVSFYNGEGPCSILKNFVVRNSFMAIFIAGSSPTLKNLNTIDNKYGIEAYAGSEPDISNCIFWNNSDSDLFGCEARYSCTSEPGQGNISADPCFVDPNNSDYHLLSQRGRYWPRADVWVLDKVTSPCIDGGDPDDDVLDEPMPNGGRIDMGAFGGTPFASMSEIKWLDGDINHDGVVNLVDLAMLAENWLRTGIGPGFPANYNWLSYNGHHYALTLQYGTWEQAEAEAVAVGGHLVTINNQVENYWAVETINNIYTQGGLHNIAWIGLEYVSGDRSNPNSWRWVNGEPVTYWRPYSYGLALGNHMYLEGNSQIDPGGWNCGTSHETDPSKFPRGIIELPW